MNNSMELSFKINNEEMEKFKKILTSGGVRHYLIKITNGEELDVVEYKEYQKLEQENQELKKQLSNDYQIKMKQLQQENRKLKQQLSNSHQIKNQQKEFIEYLENEIKRLENIEFYIESMQKVAIATHKHNLSKYREIIDGKEYCVEKDENANQINVSHNCKYINLLNEYQNWLAKEKEVVYRDCGHTQKAITKCYDKLVYLRKIYKDDYDIG